MYTHVCIYSYINFLTYSGNQTQIEDEETKTKFKKTNIPSNMNITESSISNVSNTDNQSRNFEKLSTMKSSFDNVNSGNSSSDYSSSKSLPASYNPPPTLTPYNLPAKDPLNTMRSMDTPSQISNVFTLQSNIKEKDHHSVKKSRFN